jgi:hypothetical protein
MCVSHHDSFESGSVKDASPYVRKIKDFHAAAVKYFPVKLRFFCRTPDQRLRDGAIFADPANDSVTWRD